MPPLPPMAVSRSNTSLPMPVPSTAQTETSQVQECCHCPLTFSNTQMTPGLNNASISRFNSLFTSALSRACAVYCWCVTGDPAMKTALFITAKGCPAGQASIHPPERKSTWNCNYTNTLIPLLTLPAARTKLQTTFSIGLEPQKRWFKNRPKSAKSRGRVWTSPCLDKRVGGGLLQTIPVSPAPPTPPPPSATLPPAPLYHNSPSVSDPHLVQAWPRLSTTTPCCCCFPCPQLCLCNGDRRDCGTLVRPVGTLLAAQ